MLKDDLFIHGRQPVFELLRSKHPVSQLVCANELEDNFKQKIYSLAEKKNIKIDYIPKAEIQRYSGAVVHQGIIAHIKKYHYIEEEMIDDIEGKKLLEGYRGMPEVDREELISLILKISKLLEENPIIKEMDLNPIVATKNGIKAIDARIILE